MALAAGPTGAGLLASLHTDGACFHPTCWSLLLGGAFELVSCPHYLGEVVLYAGLVAATAGQRATVWLMLLWVVSSLLGAAVVGVVGALHAVPELRIL